MSCNLTLNNVIHFADDCFILVLFLKPLSYLFKVLVSTAIATNFKSPLRAVMG